jgi:hypothetical protein
MRLPLASLSIPDARVLDWINDLPGSESPARDSFHSSLMSGFAFGPLLNF